MKKSDNSANFVRLGPIINSLISSYQKTTEPSVGKLSKIEDAWKSIAGSDIAENTKPTAIRGGLLTVNVTSSVWIQQLQYIKVELIIRLNAALKGESIENIKFKVGRI